MWRLTFQMPALICCCTGLICSVAVNLHDHLPLLRTSMLILLHSPAAKLPEHQHNQLQVCLFSAASHSIYHYFFIVCDYQEPAILRMIDVSM